MSTNYEPIGVEDIRDSLSTLQDEADAMRVYDGADREMLRQAYDGGRYLTDPDNGWIKRYAGERDEDWEERKDKLRGGINPCRLIPNKIAASMTEGLVQIQCEDQQVQDAVDEIYRDCGWPQTLRNRIELLTSIYGTIAVGPHLDARTGRIKMRWSNVDETYPVMLEGNPDAIDGLFFARQSGVFSTGDIRFSEVIDVWTPTEQARLTQDGATASQKWGLEDPSNIVNPFGCIPFAVFRARPSAQVASWFALSDIHEGSETLKFILALINDLAGTTEMQSFGQLVITAPDIDANTITLGVKRPLYLDSTGGDSADAKYIYPNAPIDKVLDLIEWFYKLAFENEGVPFSTVRSAEAPETGIAIKLRMEPLDDMTRERKSRHTKAERDLYIYTWMADQIYNHGRVFAWQEAQDILFSMANEIAVEYCGKYDKTDEEQEVVVLDALDEMGILDPYEKWQRLHPGGSEDEWHEWEEKRHEREQWLKDLRGEHEGVTVPMGGAMVPTQEEDEMPFGNKGTNEERITHA